MNSIERKYPPVGPLDRAVGEYNPDGTIKGIVSVFGQKSFFEDHEILIVHPNIRQELIGDYFDYRRNVTEKVYAFYTEHGKGIIQQLATQSCTAATAAMLIKDHGGTPDLSELQFRVMGDTPDIIHDIKKAGMEPQKLACQSLVQLRQALLQNGSAIVSVCDPVLGNHSIVVDEVSADLQQIRLRDPYHGWEITVLESIFLPRWPDFDRLIIQILEPQPPLEEPKPQSEKPQPRLEEPKTGLEEAPTIDHSQMLFNFLPPLFPSFEKESPLISEWAEYLQSTRVSS